MSRRKVLVLSQEKAKKMARNYIRNSLLSLRGCPYHKWDQDMHELDEQLRVSLHLTDTAV